MKVVCGYDPGESHRARFARWADEGAQVVVSPEEDVAKFASDLRDAEVLLHILRPVTEEVLAGAPRLRPSRRSGSGSTPSTSKRRDEGDYRYFRTENETRSLHHYVYSLFEERLREHDLVAEVDAGFDFNEWTEDRFRDGQFVRVTGLVRLMDYGWISTMMEALPSMMRAAHGGGIHLELAYGYSPLSGERGHLLPLRANLIQRLLMPCWLSARRPASGATSSPARPDRGWAGRGALVGPGVRVRGKVPAALPQLAWSHGAPLVRR